MKGEEKSAESTDKDAHAVGGKSGASANSRGRHGCREREERDLAAKWWCLGAQYRLVDPVGRTRLSRHNHRSSHKKKSESQSQSQTLSQGYPKAVTVRRRRAGRPVLFFARRHVPVLAAATTTALAQRTYCDSAEEPKVLGAVLLFRHGARSAIFRLPDADGSNGVRAGGPEECGGCGEPDTQQTKRVETTCAD